MDQLKLIQIEALHSVLKDTPEYKLREIQRWYSEKFHTKLHFVEHKLDVEYVLKHWFECKYADMTPEERDDELKLLLESDAQRQERLRKEEAESISDEEFLRQTREQAKNAKSLATATANKDAEPIIPVPVMGGPPTTFQEVSSKPILSLPEGIKMEFSDDNADDWDLFGAPSRDKDK